MEVHTDIKKCMGVLHLRFLFYVSGATKTLPLYMEEVMYVDIAEVGLRNL